MGKKEDNNQSSDEYSDKENDRRNVKRKLEGRVMKTKTANVVSIFSDVQISLLLDSSVAFFICSMYLNF